MRFMMFMIPNIPDEQWGPPPEAVAAMEKYNQEMEKAGIPLPHRRRRPIGAWTCDSAADRRR
ncbi:MAG: hypothetical protein ACYDA6_03560 [Solirubrobacteraceae bacterium]